MLGNAFIFENIGQSLLAVLKDNEIMFAISQIILLLIVEWYHEKKNLISMIASRPVWLRWSLYLLFVFYVVLFGVMSVPQEFIYFQF
jgi:hypothetical protein